MNPLWPLMIALVPLAVIAQSGSGSTGGAPENDRARNSRNSIPYSGGGIRGVTATVADGVLVTASEARDFQGDAGYYEPLPLRPRAVLPGVDVIRPQPAPDLKAKSPFALQVRFRATPDAAVVPSTLRVLYGADRVDITERVTRVAKVDAQGFVFEGFQLPPGRHRLFFVIQDEKQRTAERELRLEIE